MSHTVKVNMIADQEINILGQQVNIHNIWTIIVDEGGKIINAYLEPKLVEGKYTGWLLEQNEEKADRDTLITQVADWIDTQVIAELIVRHLENFGDALTLESAKASWYCELEELGVRIHGGG